MRAWVELTVPEFLRLAPRQVAQQLLHAQVSQGYASEEAQLMAWEEQSTVLAEALSHPDWADGVLALEFDMLRLEKRIDAVLIVPEGIFVLEFKCGAKASSPADHAQAEDYAQDLWDFHAASRGHPIQPIVIPTRMRAGRPWQMPAGIAGVAPVVALAADGLGGALAALRRNWQAPSAPLAPATWCRAPYRPVPTIVEAAARLFARNSVRDIAEARADTDNLTRATQAIQAALGAAREEGRHVVVFVTGVPGAGKTLCGLNTVFGEERRQGTAFLTGNSPLVAVLREALALNRAGVNLDLGPSNDPAARKRATHAKLRQARHETSQALQDVHQFLADNAAKAEPPSERVIVFDEAQRAWDQPQAVAKTKSKKTKLTMSEPAHALDIMGRHQGFAAVVALIGQGQEINTGEAGLAEWGKVIEAAPGWSAVAPGSTLDPTTGRRCLADGPRPWMVRDGADAALQLQDLPTARGPGWSGTMR